MVRRGWWLALLLAACKGGGGGDLSAGPQYIGAGATEPHRGGTLTFSVTDDVKSVDPAVAYDEFSIYALHYTSDTLVGYADPTSPKPVTLVPQLATEIPSPEQRTMKDPTTGQDVKVYAYVFHLREGITFYDPDPAPGQQQVRPIKPEHFKYEITRLIDPDTSSPAQPFFDAIGGANELINWTPDSKKPKPADVWGIQVTGPRELSFFLIKPDPTFLYKIAMKFCAPVEPEVVERYGLDALTTHNISSGPFYLERFERSVRLIFKRNPAYWGKDTIYLDGVEMQLSVERQVAFMKFRGREIDMVDRLGAQDLLAIEDEPKWKPYVLSDRTIDVYGERFDTTMPPFTDKRVRQAFCYAINREHMAQLGYGTILPAKGPIPPDMPGYNPNLRGYPLDPAKAKQLLIEAGYPNGFDLDYFIVAPDEKTERLALAVQSDMAVVGVRLHIKRLSFPVHLQGRMSRGKIPFASDSWLEDFPDASNFMEFLFHSKNALEQNAVNSSQYKNPEVDALLDKAAVELDPGKRTAMYQQAEQMVVDDAPWVFEYHSIRVEVVEPWVKNYKVHPVWLRDIRHVWLDLPIRRK